jgi:hypothetical protein
MNQDNKVVHGLWIGTKLSNLELLTLNSFVYHGHEFHLWVYEEISTPLPIGIFVRDANEIIPKEKVFRYKHVNQFGHGKNSVAGFSDIFRYKLLYEYGGWWVDMDVTCLKPFTLKAPYVFRSHTDLEMVGNVMKCPPKSELMLQCYQESVDQINEDNKDWYGPIYILNKYVKELDLELYIVDGISFPDHFGIVNVLKNFKVELNSEYIFIHWLNEEWRNRKINKDNVRLSSVFGQLLIKHQIVSSENAFLSNLNMVTTYSPRAHLYKTVLFNPRLYFFLAKMKRKARRLLGKKTGISGGQPLSPEGISQILGAKGAALPDVPQGIWEAR